MTAQEADVHTQDIKAIAMGTALGCLHGVILRAAAQAHTAAGPGVGEPAVTCIQLSLHSEGHVHSALQTVLPNT